MNENVIRSASKQLARKQLDDLFAFEMIGFNEVYVHDYQLKKAMFLDKGCGGLRGELIELTQEADFEQFAEFGKEMLTMAISISGDGFMMFPEEVDCQHTFKEVAEMFEFELN